MKTLINETNIGDEVFWPKKEIQRVVDPGSGGGGGGPKPPADENPPHWPGPKPRQPKAPQPQPSQDKEKSEGGGEDQSGGENEEGDGTDSEITISDFDDLSDADKEAIRKALEDMQGNLDKHLPKNTTPGATNTKEEEDRLKNETNAIRKRAREVEKYKNGGRSLSSEWGRTDEVLTIHKGQINWRERLRNFFKPWITRRKEQTFTTVNRRDMTTYAGGRAPSIRPGVRTQAPQPNKLQIFVTVDTSGSVDNDMLASFMSEINGIFTQTVCNDSNIEVRVIEWTGTVSGDLLLHDKNFAKHFNSVKRTASGGTNFAAIKQYLISKKYKPVAIVHFTDADMHFDRSMLFKDGGCKNIIVIPEGFTSSINACKKAFDEVIPMVVYNTEKD